MRPGRKSLRAAGVLLAALAAAFGSVGAADRPTTILLVRHAEKGGGQDPPLTAAGRARAEALVRIGEAAGVTALYASDRRRTRETLAPLAGRLGLRVQEIPLDAADPKEYGKGLAKRILAEHPGEVVLVAGHTNTIPPIVDALGAGPAPVLGEDAYDDLIVVTIWEEGEASLVRLKYGSPSP